MTPAGVQIRATQTAIPDDPDFHAAAAATFARQQALVLPGFLDAAMQATLARVWRNAPFLRNEIKITGSRAVEMPARGGHLLQLLLNRGALRGWLERITGLAPLAVASGAIVRMEAGAGDHLGWHNDQGDPTRRMAITINLGDTHYEGGRFEMRRRGEDDLLFAHDHVEPGTALVFAVSKALEHRVTPMTAGGPRTVFTGWYLSEPPANSSRPV
jgi:hypothetical protein